MRIQLTDYAQRAILPVNLRLEYQDRPNACLMRNPARIPITQFAPAERVPIKIIHRQAGALKKGPLKLDLLESGGNSVLVLNRQRQIVFASRDVRNLLRGKQRQLLGLRLGEALGCVHASEGKGGCGTSQFCRDCGAIQAVLSSLGGKTNLREFRMTRVIGGREELLQLVVIAAPLVDQEETFSLVILSGPSKGKPRTAQPEAVSAPLKPARHKPSRKSV